MDDKLRKRILFFQIGGVLNALLGIYVLFQGHTFLAPDTARTVTIVFFVFAAVDFYFPHAMKKKWLEENARSNAGANHPPGKT